MDKNLSRRKPRRIERIVSFLSGVKVKLNLGCGFKKKEGFINVDLGEFCSPDTIVDLAHEAWPWEDNSINEIHFDFSLEQMGYSPKELMHVISEVYRVSTHEAKVVILCLHPRHDRFVLNPLCHHRISVEFFHMLNIQNNLNQIGAGMSDNCLALQYGVNFALLGFKFLLTEDMHQKISTGVLTEEMVRSKLTFENNICEALEIHLHVIKE